MFEKEEQFNSNKSFGELKKEIEELNNNGEYRENKIRVILSKKTELRVIYLALVLNDCSKVGDLEEQVYTSKRTLYTHLYKLFALGLIEQIPIIKLVIKPKELLSKKEVLILDKFERWTGGLSERKKNYFIAKTNYWALTEFGKNPNIIDWALKQDKEMKGYGNEN